MREESKRAESVARQLDQATSRADEAEMRRDQVATQRAAYFASVSSSCMHQHGSARVSANARTHARTHARTRARTHAHTHARTHARTRVQQTSDGEDNFIL
eukprot:6189296-Pleurochrysis_carterae.AAC.5